MKHFPIYVILCLASLVSSAQDTSYREKYMASAGVQSLIFTGKAAPHYPYRCTNSQYLFGDSFEPGAVVFDGMEYDGIPMNLDISAGCLCVRVSASSKPVMLDKTKVSGFTFGGHDFINLDLSPFCPAPGTVDGYAEVLDESPDMILVKKATKSVEEDKSSGVVVRSFVESVEYWLLGRSSAWHITSPGTYYKAFPERKQQLKSVWRSIPEKLREDKAYSYTELFKNICAE